MKVAFGTLVLEFDGLGALNELAPLYEAHAPRPHVQPQALVEIRIDPHACLDEQAGFRVDSCYDAESETLLLTTRRWHLEVPLQRSGPIVLSLSRWADEDFDQAVRSMIQFLAPLRAGALILHGSSVKRGGEGFAFTAHSETGKTTVARLSSDLGYTVFAEELTYVGYADGVPTLFSLPVIEVNHLNPVEPHWAPLCELYKLMQDERDAVELIPPRRRFLEIAAVAAIGMRFEVVMNPVLDLVQRLVADVEPRFLHFMPSPAFWQAIDADRAARRVGSSSPVV